MIQDLKPYPETRDSGLPWLGLVPAHWKLARLDRLFVIRAETPHDSDQRVTGYLDGRVTLRSNVAGQKIKGVIKDAGWQRVHPGDFAISGMNAHLGGMGVSDSLGKCSPIYLVLKPRNGTNPFFASHAVRRAAHSGALKALVNTIRFNSADFKRDDLKLISIAIPTTGEQDAIVRFIDHADRSIRRYVRAKQKLIKLLEEQKQAIIHRAVTRGLHPNVRLKPSGIEWLGAIPEHWEIILNQRIFKEEIRPYSGKGETQLSLSQRDGLIATSAMQERSLQTSSFDNWKVTIPGDLVLNRFKAHLGVFFASTLRGIVSFHYGVFAPRRSLVSKYFELLYHTFPYRAIYAVRSNGMTVGLQNLSNQNFYNVHSVVPPSAEQASIVSFAEEATKELSRAISDVQKEIALLREYRTRLIADVVTGKLDVREAAARLPAEAAEPEPLDADALAETDDESESTDLDEDPAEAEA
jgi:type I restriction enzyme S subunit